MIDITPTLSLLPHFGACTTVQHNRSMTDSPTSIKDVRSVSGITVRLAGDSGDGMQLLGTQLTNTSALAGNDVATFPDFPAEIRAPRGTRAGVSADSKFSLPAKRSLRPATHWMRWW